MHLFLRARIDEGQLLGVQALSVDQCLVMRFKFGVRASVDRVAQERMSDRCHVYADLMGAPGLQLAAKQRKALSVGFTAREYRPMCDSITRLEITVADDRHALAVDGVSADRRVHRAAVLFEIANGDRVVGAADVVSLQLRREREVRFIVFGDDQESRGILVNAVNDSGANDSAHAR